MNSYMNVILLGVIFMVITSAICPHKDVVYYNTPLFGFPVKTCNSKPLSPPPPPPPPTYCPIGKILVVEYTSLFRFPVNVCRPGQ